MEIVNKLLYLIRIAGVKLLLQHKVASVTPIHNTDEENTNNHYRIDFELLPDNTIYTDYVIVTTGGSPKVSGLDMLSPLALEIEQPVPSLFGLCLPNHPLTQMTGTVVEDNVVGLVKTKIKTRGPLLITHRGLSGPATLKLSSHGARTLAENNYEADIVVKWLGESTEQEALDYLHGVAEANPMKQLQNIYPNQLNSRLCHYLLLAAGLRPDTRWAELGRKGYNRLAVHITAHPLHVSGRDAFKDEFVTCGGVSLSNINVNTLESKEHRGIFFAGEVLDVDAVTGGFNLQAAWTMAFVVAKGLCTAIEERGNS